MTAERGLRSPGTGQKLRLRATEPMPQWTAKNLHALLDLPAAMELRQIELIYRAEGNANLVLALPQFKKVLRLPKMISSRLRQAAHQRHELADEVARPEGQRVSSERAGTENGSYTRADKMEPECLKCMNLIYSPFNPICAVIF